MTAELKLDNFETSPGLFRRFMTIKNLSLRRKTTNCKTPPLLLIS